ncbi:MAG: replication-associated recombination protein A [Mycoplasma sp.]
MKNREDLNIILRPKTINDIVGQTHILNDDSLIKRMIKNNVLYSLIFYGQPGIGKTSLAISVANELNIPYSIFNASIDNKKTLTDIIDAANKTNHYLIILEEVHRLNKDKQDILLPHIESGRINIFATTTENPYFKINPALRSRCQILQLKPISADEMFIGLKKFIKKIGNSINIEDEDLLTLANFVNGDLRAAVNVLDIIHNIYTNEKITKELLSNIISQPIILGSHYGDELHDLKSAFHKSLRGSDIDASLHYLARLISIEALDDISRRMLAVAYEDIGLANPNLALRVSSGIDSCYRLGFPEAKIILSSLCIQLAGSPKSNTAYIAIESALQDVREGKSFPIPNHLRDSHYASASKLGVIGYKYPHNFPNSYVEQQYLPTKLIGKKYYIPNKENDFEIKLENWLLDLKK